MADKIFSDTFLKKKSINKIPNLYKDFPCAICGFYSDYCMGWGYHMFYLAEFQKNDSQNHNIIMDR